MSCSGFHLIILQSSRQGKHMIGKYVADSVKSSKMFYEDILEKDI